MNAMELSASLDIFVTLSPAMDTFVVLLASLETFVIVSVIINTFVTLSVIIDPFVALSVSLNTFAAPSSSLTTLITPSSSLATLITHSSPHIPSPSPPQRARRTCGASGGAPSGRWRTRNLLRRGTQNLQSESLTLSGTQAGRDSAVIPIASSSSAKFAGFTPQSFRMELNWFGQLQRRTRELDRPLTVREEEW